MTPGAAVRMSSGANWLQMIRPAAWQEMSTPMEVAESFRAAASAGR